MMRTEEIIYGLQNLWHRKTRSILTIVSILMGIAAVFALMSFGLGIQSYVDQVAADAGTDKLFIMARSMGAPGTDDTFSLTAEDVSFVDKRKGVKETEAMYMAPAQIEFKGEKRFYFLVAFDTRKSDFVEQAMTVEIEKGRRLGKGDDNMVILGYNYMIEDKIFSREITTGDKVYINAELFEVAGFYTEVGNPGDDANIIITKDAFERLYPEKKDRFSYVMLQAESGVDTEELAETLEEKLGRFKGMEEGKETFYVQTFADLLETFGTVIDIINNVLLLIAFVSLVVAAVNIMNTMYTAVLERTKEIGVMKAIGARNEDILFIFVFESGVLGLIGGVLGIIVGYLIASAGGAFAAASGYSTLQPTFPLWLIIGCIVFAFFVGAISGFLPARQASRLRPVDALRYE
jgi:putative ABC transport system permease protein